MLYSDPCGTSNADLIKDVIINLYGELARLQVIRRVWTYEAGRKKPYERLNYRSDSPKQKMIVHHLTKYDFSESNSLSSSIDSNLVKRVVFSSDMLTIQKRKEQLNTGNDNFYKAFSFASVFISVLPQVPEILAGDQLSSLLMARQRQ